MSFGALWLSYAYPSTVATPTGTVINSLFGTPSSATGGTSAKQKFYTVTETANHKTPSDCWLIVRGSVYDVSSYLGAHPGGRRVITDRCGGEVTSVFSQIHSNRAWNLLGAYLIGTVGTAPVSGTPVAAISTTSAVSNLSQKVIAAFPGSDVLKVEPQGTGYHAVVVSGQSLIDVVLNDQGTIVSQQVRDDEFEWFWHADDDEVQEWKDS
ncbi:hypothetical protein COV06_00380 [Candidatus Uhrbacteria bacterium CG10_big_fil_rev_8_21_14_0_10_50_16]|uniref:Cytochrome b5 heme-binding domain-containing protein n=1 Tax=Candidatus Uhrbacteria bacterium CG10_big_fil_rev_8_21_14_0_10_50_16 TaxID=1975039 RepID=A0A2H0RQS1_9BACT|nr:MAG: hypothetical protein COV06_00380 [Candidatus Uhrbacteria bacterium CG10_big_fil_rev_8_21_14_0_10_50_16]